jgi:hypothetical protein
MTNHVDVEKGGLNAGPCQNPSLNIHHTGKCTLTSVNHWWPFLMRFECPLVAQAV